MVNTQFFFTFSQISIYTGDKSRAIKFASSGIDGRFVVWDVKVSTLHSVVFSMACIMIKSEKHFLFERNFEIIKIGLYSSSIFYFLI